MIHDWPGMAADATESLPTPMADYLPAHSPHLLSLQKKQHLYNDLSGDYSLLSEGKDQAQLTFSHDNLRLCA